MHECYAMQILKTKKKKKKKKKTKNKKKKQTNKQTNKQRRMVTKNREIKHKDRDKKTQLD